MKLHNHTNVLADIPFLKVRLVTIVINVGKSHIFWTSSVSSLQTHSTNSHFITIIIVPITKCSNMIGCQSGTMFQKYVLQVDLIVLSTIRSPKIQTYRQSHGLKFRMVGTYNNSYFPYVRKKGKVIFDHSTTLTALNWLFQIQTVRFDLSDYKHL